MRSCPSENCCNTGRKNPPQGTIWDVTNQTFMTNIRRNPPRTTTDPQTYCQFVRPVTFQHNNPTLSLTALSVGGDRPSPPCGSGATHAAPELINNATVTPKSSTPMALGGGNLTSNLTPLKGLEDQELSANIDSDATSARNFGANDDDLAYLRSRKNSPAIENTTLDLLAIIEDAGNILEAFGEGLN